MIQETLSTPQVFLEEALILQIESTELSWMTPYIQYMVNGVEPTGLM